MATKETDIDTIEKQQVGDIDVITNLMIIYAYIHIDKKLLETNRDGNHSSVINYKYAVRHLMFQYRTLRFFR